MANATLMMRLAVLGLLLAACEQTPAPVTEAVPVAPAPAYVERHVSVTLSQGTDLAVAVDPASGDRVLSLQGSLFLLPADNSAARTLTDAYYDAREPQFSPDGSRIVFHGYRNGNWDIWSVGRDGAAPAAVTADAFDDREPQYSADGARVLFSSDRGGSYDIWSVDLASGELTQHTDHAANAWSPSWSHDGALAYATEGDQGARLMVLHVDGTEQMLAEHAGVISGVQWSPDGTQVSYQLFSGAATQLKVVDLASGSDRTISNPGADIFPFKASWLADDKLAYAADGNVFTRNVSAGERADWPFAITLDLIRHDYTRRVRSYDASEQRLALGLGSPTISADGEHIYFSALGDLWHWLPTSQTLRQLTDDAYAEYSPTLSPDGQTLAYVSDTDGEVGLRLLTLSTGAIERVKIDAQQVSVPAWSPDGEQIAFFVDVPGNPLGGQLMVMHLASGELTKILEPIPAQPVSWSADGAKVAVARLNTYSSRYREGLYELLVIDVRSQQSSAISPVAHRSILNGVLTPDGAMTYVEGGLLYRLELDEALQPLESAGAVTSELTDMPQWSANGEYLVYLSGNRLKRLHATTGTLTDITPQLPYTLDEPADTYVLRAGRIFTGAGDEYLLDHDIWINHNRIEKIVPRDSYVTLPVVDMSDKTVVAGLFEMHAHMGENSESQGRVWLSYGITTVRDPGSNPYAAKERQEAWDSGRRIGPRTHITGYLTDGNRVFYSIAEGIVSTPHLERALARTQQLELDFIKTYVRLPDHWQRQVVNFAHKLGIPVSSHELYPAVAHGMDHVEHIGGTSRRGYQPKVSRLGYSYDDVVSLLVESGMGITATAVLPGFAVIVSEEPDWFETPQFEHFYGAAARRSYEMMTTRFGPGASAIAKANGRLLKTLTEQGALLVTGTDSPFVPYGAGLHAEFRLFDRAGISAADIIRQATINAAQAAGVANELGTVEVGKLADLVVLDGDPLADIRDLDNVVMTIKNGRRYTLEQLLALPN